MDGTRAYSLVCLRIPGLHLPKAGIAFSTFLLQILTIQLFVQVFHTFIFARFHLTPIVTQMFAGIMLCPKTQWAHNEVYDILHNTIFPFQTKNVDETLAMLSYILYSFLIAVKMDFSIVTKTGRKAFVIGILDVIIPVFLNLWFLSYLYPNLLQKLRDKDQDVAELYLNLTTLPLTHFPNVAVFLMDLKMINSELGRLALSSSLIGHILSMVLLMIANLITRPVSNPILLVIPFMLVLVSVFIFKPIFNWMVKRTPKGRPVKQVFVSSGILLMLLGGLSTRYSGQLTLLGAFIVGAVVPDGPPLGYAIVEKLDFLVSSVLLPFFVTTSFMGIDFTEIKSARITFYHLSLAILAYLAKFLNSLVCGLYSKMQFDDALALSFIMSIKGIVDVGALIMFREAMVLSTANYTIMMVWTMFIAVITPIFVKSLYHPLKKYAGYQRRDIMHCKYNSELRILACFMRPDRVHSLTRLINACCPSENNNIAVYALHLVKMVGRAHPIFIAHDTQKKKDSANNFSEDVIWAFYRFEQRCKDFLAIHIYTAVSPFEAFHEDTCTLALDKLVSIIVLPFYRRFRIDGSIDSEDPEQKAINHELLSRSPCSVAILVDRGNFGHFATPSALNTITTTDSSSPLSVAVVYIGGLDDQEALAFAKRMGRDSRVRVHVIRLVAFGQSRDLDALDSAALMDIQKNVLYNQQFLYTEKAVKDGADTATFLKSTVDTYNLMLVGRHYNFACSQLMGLKDLSEETELGTIGDFLASQDLECKTSVLVVQQQRQWTK